MTWLIGSSGPSKWWAGFGSRKAPSSVLPIMTKVAAELSRQGYRCRSGGAIGSDSAFKRGDPSALVIRPEDATPDAIGIASTHHRNWNACDEYARKCHGRNVMIMIGPELDEWAQFGVCWMRPGNTRGGTFFGVSFCDNLRIPVYNLATADGMAWAVRLIGGLQ